MCKSLISKRCCAGAIFYAEMTLLDVGNAKNELTNCECRRAGISNPNNTEYKTTEMTNLLIYVTCRPLDVCNFFYWVWERFTCQVSSILGKTHMDSFVCLLSEQYHVHRSRELILKLCLSYFSKYGQN
jgi:hypothetical protein